MLRLPGLPGLLPDPLCLFALGFQFQDLLQEAVEVEPMFKSQLAASDYKKLPQLRFGGEGGPYLVDSDHIAFQLQEDVDSFLRSTPWHRCWVSRGSCEM